MVEKVKKTFNELLKDVKEGNSGIGKWVIVMNDVPVLLAEQFFNDVKAKYNNMYWVKLQDLIRKAEAYDYLVTNQYTQYQEEPVYEDKQKEEKEDKGIITFSGKYGTD